MQLDEYVKYDGLGLAELVRSGGASPSELAQALPWRNRVPPVHESRA